MAKVVFIEPAGLFNGYSYSGLNRLPLMGSLCLGTILKEAGHEVVILRDKVKSVYDRKREKLHEAILRADVIAMSMLTSTSIRGYQISDAIRKVSPKTKIIMGGPHPTYMSEEAIQHSDLVVKGEGEEEILDAVNDINLTGIIQGRPVEDLNKYPFPDFSILSDQKRPLKRTPISTSRGCPYNCVFCTVSSTFGRKYRFRDPEKVLEEIEARVAQGHSHFFFYDDNFAANREGTKVLLEGIIRRNLNITWTAEARTNIAKDDELLELMHRAHCKYMCVGLESVNPKALEAYNKKQTVEDVKMCISNLKNHDISVHGMFILGSDEDDSNTAKDTVKFCHDVKLDTAQFAVLHPLPGSRLYDIMESEKRIFTKNWSLYDGTHVVFKPKKMSPLELQSRYLWAWKKFYSLRRKPLRYPVCRSIIGKWRKSNKGTMADLKKRFGSIAEKYPIRRETKQGN